MHILNDLQPENFDLHIHTTASDGIYTPSEIVKKAKSVGLTTIAITDHDTLAGVEEAQHAGEQVGLQVWAGVEISTRYKGISVDILGYNMSDCLTLHQQLSTFRDARYSRALGIIQKCMDLGMPLTMDDVLEFSGTGVITRPHIAKALAQKGYVPDVQSAFDHYLGEGKPANVNKKELTPEEGIQWIQQTGGQAVLAHPVYIGNDEIVRELVQLGMNGIEVWHRSHTSLDSKRYLSIADEYQLKVTGGSDFHTDEHNLGCFGAPTQ
ncbi:PHP domain-containing protein [Kroppenstedtia pulmonis]|uniref:PHP domain-containing protein n=1 Tax=Kroppenstedtia pulmonis TaxID=1380685 RepID=A0A7D4BGM1_9BACL|nr:PHP domain-containing protein [Kroppenstedtia pulmonis]QKG85172.1 PHP domain-containing protein [Kroppenstedtia pulmonis]